MNVRKTISRYSRRRRSATALVAAAAVVPLAFAALIPATASASPPRNASTTTYTDTTFLQDALGLPTTDTSPVIESVTYDRFQWLLQQPGKFAFLIGDPAEDANFAARAQDVEAAAKAAGVKKVYWFDPNLSGNAKVGSTTEPNLDIRNPGGITSLPAASENIYARAWLNLVGQYLGDGVTATPYSIGSESQASSIQLGTTTVNDYGVNNGYSTAISNGAANLNGGALYNYTAVTTGNLLTTTPTGAKDSYFFIYNKDNTVTVSSVAQPEKIVSWIDLDNESSSVQTQADVTTAIGTVGAANVTELDQSAWWQSEVNSKEIAQAPSNAQGGNVPVLSSSDSSAANGGWRIDQVTYPELVDLLKNPATATANAVILFGGTWCPNTRPVLPFINKEAQQNNVEVFNFDTVLDGGTTGGSTTSDAIPGVITAGGGTTSSSNPLQSRNAAAGGTPSSRTPIPRSSTAILRGRTSRTSSRSTTPRWVAAQVTYFPGGDTTKALTTVNKLQVPFLIGYQQNSTLNPDISSGGGVTRQWIEENLDTSGLPYFTEYMSVWWYTNPQPNEIGISTIPLDAPIWTTINSELASVTWKTDPNTLAPSSTGDTDDAQYLDSADTATVTYTAASGGTPASVSVTSAGASPISISPGALSAALSALGTFGSGESRRGEDGSHHRRDGNVAGRHADLQPGHDRRCLGCGSAAQDEGRRSSGAAVANPSQLIGGAGAVHALDLFFGGLPGGVVSTQTVTAPTVSYGGSTAPAITVAIANAYGASRTGTSRWSSRRRARRSHRGRPRSRRTRPPSHSRL